MKRYLLLLVSALLTLSLSAQLKYTETNRLPARPQLQVFKPEAKKEVAHKRIPGTPVEKKVSNKSSNKGIWYRRPAGAFPASLVVEDGAYAGVLYAPYIAMTPYVDYTFTGMVETEYPDAEFTWDVQLYDINESTGEEEQMWTNVPGMGDSGKDLTVMYDYETDDVPIFCRENPDYATFQLKGYEMGGTSAAPTITAEHTSTILSVPSTMLIWDTDFLKSSKNFAYGGINGDNRYPFTYYSGAEPYPGNEEGWWFGKNGGVKQDLISIDCEHVDGIAQAFEKPTAPYLLNQVVLDCAVLEVADQVDMTCRIYKLDEIPPYIEDDEAILPEEPGELIAMGRATVTPQTEATTGRLIFFTLYDVDGITKMTPTIDCVILVVIDGYNDPEMANLTDFSALICSDDEWDEGFGELAYMKVGKESNTGSINYHWAGLNNFFTSGGMKTGFSIFLSTENPYLTFKNKSEDGKYTFPSEGGLMEKDLDGYKTRSIEFFSWTESATGVWNLSCNDDEVPEWLSIELADGKTSGEFNGVVNAEVIAEPLPEGVTGRKAVVRFGIPGNYIDYLFMQGDVDPNIPEDTMYDFVENGIYYIVTDQHEVSVTCRDKQYNTYSGNIIIPDEVTHDGITYAVTGIAENAFRRCYNMPSIAIPVSVISIANKAFYLCSVKEVCITGNGEWLAGPLPSTVKTLYIGSGVTSISDLNVNPSTIYSYPTVPPICNDNTFTGYDANLYIPDASVASYFIADYWCNFINIIGNAVEPREITMSEDSLHLAINGQKTLTAVITPANATPATVSWCSTNKNVAIVENGEVRAIAKGECNILATCVGKQAVCHVTVNEIEPTSLTLSQNDVTLLIGEQLVLTATVLPEDATNKVVTWLSTDTTIATVNNGVITALIPGECNVIARCGNVRDTCHVTVTEIEATSLTLSQKTAIMVVEEQLVLTTTVLPEDATNKTVIWTSTNEGVATVNEGVVIAVAPGESDVIAQCGHVQDTCHVTVVAKIIYISLDKHEASVLPNHIISLNPTMTPEATDLKVTSSNPAVAAVRLANNKVQVVGIKEGETIIYVGSVDGTAVGDTCRVTVYTEIGDLNCDGYVNITDVTTLINYLLSGDSSNIKVANADTNCSGSVNISDVTTLINFLLSGTWPWRDMLLLTPDEAVDVQEISNTGDKLRDFVELADK